MKYTYDYKPTVALKKISKLVKSVDDLAIIQGGGGAGKTIGIEMLIIDWFNQNPNKEITICSFERTKLMDTAFHDFKKILIDYGLWYSGRWNENKSRFTFNHGVTGFIEFIGLDKADIGKGRRRDLIYINEANKITHEKYVDISLRAKKTIIDFNSDSEFWAHDYVTKENFIALTFLDNEFIPEEEKRNLLSYLERGFFDQNKKDLFSTANIKNKFFANKWKVYGLGMTGGAEGQIFTNWNRGKFNDELVFMYGLDWGWTHPMAIVKIAVDRDKKIIYAKQMLYGTNIAMPEILTFCENNIKPDDFIVCDNAEPLNIDQLRRANFNAVKCYKKGGIVQGLRWLQEYLIVVDDSPDLEKELNSYVWNDKRAEIPKDADNHIIDALRYAYTQWHLWNM